MSGNQLSGAEAFVRMLAAHDVKHIFGLCGDTSLPFYDALKRLNHGMTHVLTRDERCAAYMADCYARVSGRVGICEGPSGGGATYILPGVVEANESSVPIMAVTTDISVSARGRYTLTELDQEGLFRPLAKWTRVIDRAVDIPRTLRAAFTQMTSGRPGASHIGLPFDVQKDPVDESEIWADRSLGSFPARRTGPDPEAVNRCVELLSQSLAPVIVCGGGVVLSGAEAALERLANALEAPVATTVSGQGAIADDHPLAVGVVGSNGGVPATRAIVQAADLVVFVGCRAGSVTTERWRYPAPGRQKVVHIDVDPAVIGATYPTDGWLVGDARLCLAALADAVEAAKPDLSQRSLGRAEVAARRREKFEAFMQLAGSDDTPIRPERLVHALNEALPADAILVADPGTPCPYFSAYWLKRRTGRHFISNRAHGALGYALSGAVGAAIGRPSAKVVSVMGDGSFGFTCGEFETVVRLGLPITFVVVSNACFGWIKAGQKTGFGGRYFSVDFDRTNHARVAEAFGVKSFTVADPAALLPTLRQAIEYPGPTCVDVIAQPLHEARAPVSEWVA
ncbi:MAG: thiamine pyrophosphate-binding protein [Alphaproteobacteria bacterium]|nr:thiamine pyrophosphate-binding protein [Alphaproteobacteria bacterium]